MSNKKGKLFIVSAPAGTGKTTLVQAVLPDLPHVHQTISYTTRKPRYYEIEGVHYHFITPDEFEKMIRQGAFLEYVRLYDDYYGTTHFEVDQWIEKGENALLIIDTQGMKKLKAIRPLITIFISPPSLAILRERLENRGTDTPEQIEKRLRVAEVELNEQNLYTYHIINDNLEVAKEQLKNIILSEEG